MAEIIIDNVKYTNVPNKKAGTKFASTLTQSNIGMSQAVQDYVNSSYFYTLVNAIDINWDGIDIGENSYINTTSDLIKWIESKAGDIDLSSYATITYVNDKITELIGAAPETLDTLGEIAAALQDDASLAYVTQALSGKADKTDLNDYATVSYVTTELDKKADLDDIPSAPDLTPYLTYADANSYYATIAYVTNELASKADIIDLSTYATTAQLDNRTLIGNGGTITTFGQHALDDITEFDLKVHFIQDETLQIYIHANNIDSNSATLYLFAGSDSDTAQDENFEVYATYVEQDENSNYIWHVTCNAPVDRIAFTNSDDPTSPGIEFEMSYGSSITVIENFAYYVSYTQANSYYVDINSYNALAARVEELASWIVAYHTPGPGPEPSKPFATAQWLDSSAGVIPIGTKTVVAGDSTTYTFTFDGNPATGWTFTNTGAVQIMNTTTGDITIDVSNYTAPNIEYVSCEAYYPEDSSYQYCMTSFTVTILPAGMNPQFYYNPISCNISSTDSQYMPMIYDSIGEGHTIEYNSSNSNVATVSSDGTISYVSAGNCTITATAIDGSNNIIATATIDVTCTSSAQTPDYTNVSMYYKVGQNYDQTISKGYFDTDPIENGVDYNDSDLRIFVEFEGPQYTYNSGDFTITKDSTFDSGDYIQMGPPTLYSNVSYTNGVNSLELTLSWWVGNDSPGTNRFVFDFSHNGVSLISDGIKIYNNGEVC